MSAARLETAARRALFACALVLLLSVTQRAAAQDAWLGADKALHFSVSAGLAGGGYALAVPLVEAPWARATIGASFALTLGIAKEFYDLSGAGDASWRDLTWDVIGTATGVLIALGIEWLVEVLSETGDAPPTVSTSLLELRAQLFASERSTY